MSLFSKLHNKSFAFLIFYLLNIRFFSAISGFLADWWIAQIVIFESSLKQRFSFLKYCLPLSDTNLQYWKRKKEGFYCFLQIFETSGRETQTLSCLNKRRQARRCILERRSILPSFPSGKLYISKRASNWKYVNWICVASHVTSQTEICHNFPELNYKSSG